MTRCGGGLEFLIYDGVRAREFREGEGFNQNRLKKILDKGTRVVLWDSESKVCGL